MPHNLAVFTTAKLLALSAMGAAASAASVASAASLKMQLNEPHLFFYLQLPFWFLLVAMMILTFVGAFVSLATDYMRAAQGSTASKVATAVAVGFVLSFVVLPTFITEPNPSLMMISALVGGFSGTTLIYIAGRLIGNKQLQDAVIDLIIQRSIKFFGVALDLIFEHAKKLLGIVLVGVVASFTIVPKINDSLDAKALRPDYTEVINVKHG